MRAIEFFCGAGGTSLGLKRAGFKILAAYDYWYPAIRAYRRNVAWGAFSNDIRDVFALGQTIARQQLDIIVGSPPCQDFSKAGSRVERRNARLTQAFAMLISIARPQWFLMENVPEAAGSRAWSESRSILLRQGYGLTELVLNAAYYGVPQFRRRLFVVGRLGEREGFLSSDIISAAAMTPMTVRDMLISNVPEDEELRALGHYYMRPFTGGRGVRSIDDPSPTVIRTAAAAPGPAYLKNPHKDDPIPAKQAHVLTRGQTSRIQGFPIGFDWSPIGRKYDIDQAIANAVPPALSEAVGRVIMKRHRGETRPEVQDGFEDWIRIRGKSERFVANIKANVNRARRILGGRTYADANMEIAMLEGAGDFNNLATQTKSDLRTALRLYADYCDGKS